MEKDKTRKEQGKQYHEVDKMYAFRHPTVHSEEHMAHHQDGMKRKHVLPHEAEA